MSVSPCTVANATLGKSTIPISIEGWWNSICQFCREKCQFRRWHNTVYGKSCAAKHPSLSAVFLAIASIVPGPVNYAGMTNYGDAEQHTSSSRMNLSYSRCSSPESHAKFSVSDLIS
jgi:hypothetical protein